MQDVAGAQVREIAVVRLRLLLGDAALRDHLGTAARARALEEFAEERLVGALEDRYREILGG